MAAVNIALFVVGGLLALIASVLLFAYWHQERLLFRPQKLPEDFPLRQAGVQEESIAVDGARLSALHLKLPAPKGLVFYLHGNAGSLVDWFVNVDFYRKANFDLFMIDYRGYGKSTGRITSEAQLRQDVAAAWAQVAPQYAGKRIVVLGRSLGTALAAGLAAQVNPDLTILVSPYWSMVEMARLQFPGLPTSLLRYRLETCRDVPRIAAPLLLVHGERDALIPVSQCRRLGAAAPAATVLVVPGAGHNDLQDFPVYCDAIAGRLASL